MKYNLLADKSLDAWSQNENDPAPTLRSCEANPSSYASCSRSPRSGMWAIVSEESASKILVSEASTLKYRRTHSSIPVPEVFTYSGSSINDMGVPYILMSRASGRPLPDHDWMDRPSRTSRYTSSMKLPHLLDDEGQHAKIGSIVEDANDQNAYTIGDCLSPAFLWQWGDSLEGFDRELPLSPNVFFAPISQVSEFPTLESHLAAVNQWNDDASFLRDMIPKLCVGDADLTLSHPDLHVGNVFADEQFNITCILDWGSAICSPITELLATPALWKPTLPSSESLKMACISGINSGCRFDSDYWVKAEEIRLVIRLVRLFVKQDYNISKALYGLVYKPEIEESHEELNKAEDDVFGGFEAVKSGRLVVARKSTLVSEMNPEFVADNIL
ncbi:hypothetical protein EDB81DRAFT_871738 [Dactylonectria macrodidyma]|uniref:Aminoglycoside phosphotransferase domain-containing protein n=1 Tax=Dactylonectria macrodidyma TaxID=307937 RepID=A0A9P9E1C2_9HYPO|nr:hypothetical protein EDB81DRAFT_871738 [Dactylonectria macrodidyma]